MAEESFPSAVWLSRLCAAINRSSEFLRLGRGWTWRVAIVVLEDSEGSLSPVAGPVELVLELNNGKCSSASISPASGKDNTPYRLIGTRETWREVLKQGGLDPALLIATERIRVRGDLPRIHKFREAAALILRLARGLG